MQSREQNKAKARLEAIKLVSKRLFIFGLVYLASSLLSLYYYLVYLGLLYDYDSALSNNRTQVAENLVDPIVSAYFNYHVVMVVTNIAIILALVLVLFALKKFQIIFGWEKSVKTTHVLMVLLIGFGVSVFLYIAWYAYSSLEYLRAYLLDYVRSGGEAVPQGASAESILYGYLLAYFIVGMALFYGVNTVSRIIGNFKSLSVLSKRYKWFLWVAFLYFFEPYIPIKLTWLLFPVFSYIIHKEASKLSI